MLINRTRKLSRKQPTFFQPGQTDRDLSSTQHDSSSKTKIKDSKKKGCSSNRSQREMPVKRNYQKMSRTKEEQFPKRQRKERTEGPNYNASSTDCASPDISVDTSSSHRKEGIFSTGGLQSMGQSQVACNGSISSHQYSESQKSTKNQIQMVCNAEQNVICTTSSKSASCQQLSSKDALSLNHATATESKINHQESCGTDYQTILSNDNTPSVTSRNLKGSEPTSNREVDVKQHVKGVYKAYAPSQLISEDIKCGTGLAFQFLDSELDDDQNTDYSWHDRYADRPGVTRWQPSKKGSHKSICSNETSDVENVRYRSRLTFQGASINLGNHILSASAAAAQDLANLLLWGSDDPKPMTVLSRMEAWEALKAAGVLGIQPGGHVDPFCSRFTEVQKKIFEYNIERALSSIGGHDDELASLLSSVDTEAQKQAELEDKLERDRKMLILKEEEREKARATRRARLKEKKMKETLGIEIYNIGNDALLFFGEHGVFDVDDCGVFSWRKRPSQAYKSSYKKEQR